VILIVCWVVFPAVIYIDKRKTGDFPPVERWLIHPILFLVMWYVLSTAVDQVRHGPYEFDRVWPSSFAASAFFASALLILGFREPRGVRWFLVVGFLTATAVFGLFFQVLSWLLPRYATVVLRAL